MKFSYGIENEYIDITKKVYTQCIKDNKILNIKYFNYILHK